MDFVIRTRVQLSRNRKDIALMQRVASSGLRPVAGDMLVGDRWGAAFEGDGRKVTICEIDLDRRMLVCWLAPDRESWRCIPELYSDSQSMLKQCYAGFVRLEY